MNRVLLTGATGFLGSHLLEALLQQGDEVTILKRTTSDTWRIKHLLDNVAAFDVDKQPLEEAFKPNKFDAVIHTACSYGRHGEPMHSVVESNLLFGLRVLDAAIFYETRTFINTDTYFNAGALLSKHLIAYSLSKKHLVEWLKYSSNNIQVLNLKIQHMYGPKDDKSKFVPWLINQLDQEVARVPLTEGQQLRDFIYVEDVVAAYIITMKNLTRLERFSEFEVGTSKLTSVRVFSEELLDCFLHRNPKMKTVLGFGDIPLKDGEIVNVNVDNSALKNLGWSSNFTVSDGLKKTLNFDDFGR